MILKQRLLPKKLIVLVIILCTLITTWVFGEEITHYASLFSQRIQARYHATAAEEDADYYVFFYENGSWNYKQRFTAFTEAENYLRQNARFGSHLKPEPPVQRPTGDYDYFYDVPPDILPSFTPKETGRNYNPCGGYAWGCDSESTLVAENLRQCSFWGTPPTHCETHPLTAWQFQNAMGSGANVNAAWQTVYRTIGTWTENNQQHSQQRDETIHLNIKYACIPPGSSTADDNYGIAVNTNSTVCVDLRDKNYRAEILKSPHPQTVKNSGDTCMAAGDPVNTANGNVFEKVTEYEGHQPFPLVVHRYYNSLFQNNSSMLGYQWGMDYLQNAQFVGSNGQATAVTMVRPDGTAQHFTINGTTITGEPGTAGKVEWKKLSNGAWDLIYHLPNGINEHYNGYGKLTQIDNRAGVIQKVYQSDDEVDVSEGDNSIQIIRDSDTGYVKELKLPDGSFFVYHYDGKSNLVKVETFTNPLSSVIVYEYTDPRFPHALTGIIDNNNNRIAHWEYDDKGRAIINEQAAGTGHYRFDYMDEITNITNPLGGTTSHQIADIHGLKLVKTVSEDGAAEQFEYDDYGRPTSVTDKNGVVDRYQYSDIGLLQTVTTAVGTPLAANYIFRWDDNLRLPLTLDVGADQRHTFMYDANYQLIYHTITDSMTGKERATHYGYAPLAPHLLTSIQLSGDSAETKLDYDNRNNLGQITNPLGQKIIITATDSTGLPAEWTDFNGIKTNRYYDYHGHLYLETRGDARTGLHRNALEELDRVTEPNKVAWGYEYDINHRLIRIINAVGDYIQYTRNALGQIATIEWRDKSNRVLRSLHVDYDNYGRIWQETDGEGYSTLYEYDKAGNLTQRTDALKHITKNIINALNAPDITINALAETTHYTYDPYGAVTSVTLPNGSRTTYEYNGFGDLVTENSSDSGNTTYTYDARGLLETETDNIGHTTRYGYDALHRLTEVTYADGNAIRYEYDQGNYGVGYLTHIIDSSGETRYNYDMYGHLLQQTSVIAGKSYVVKSNRDLSGLLLNQTYPDGHVLQLSRDASGHVTQLNWDGKALASNVHYLPMGPVDKFTLGTGAVVNRVFDHNYQLLNQTVTGVADDNYIYDGAGNLTQFTDKRDNTQSIKYEYDALNRLKHLEAIMATETYDYDGNGNRLSKMTPQGKTGYTYVGNRLATLTGIGAKAIDSNALGALTQKGDQHYEYNDAHRLVSVTVNGTTVLRNQYNGRGERVVKTTAAGSTAFIYDATGHLIETVKGDDITDFVYLNDEPLAMIQNGTVYYFLNDQLGTPKYLLNDSSVVWQGGSVGFTVQGKGTGKHPLGFLGQYYDEESALWQNGFRDYDPELGRYLEADPVGLASGSFNPYAYVDNNPQKWTDPQGLMAIAIAASEEGAEIGALAGPAGAIIGGAGGLAIGGGIEWAADHWLQESAEDAGKEGKVCPDNNLYKKKYSKGDDVGLDRFTKPGKRGVRTDPKTGEQLEPDKNQNSGNGPHGGSWWKLKDKRGNRIGTITKDGRWIRT